MNRPMSWIHAAQQHSMSFSSHIFTDYTQKSDTGELTHANTLAQIFQSTVNTGWRLELRCCHIEVAAAVGELSCSSTNKQHCYVCACTWVFTGLRVLVWLCVFSFCEPKCQVTFHGHMEAKDTDQGSCFWSVFSPHVHFLPCGQVSLSPLQIDSVTKLQEACHRSAV